MNLFNFTHILTQTVDELSESESYQALFHQHKDGEPLPSAKKLHEIIELSRSILFPGYYGKSTINSRTLKYHIGVNVEKLFQLLSEQVLSGLCFNCKKKERDSHCYDNKELAHSLAAKFISQLPELRKKLATDVIAAYNGDPASESMGEVIFCYPSIKAISNYRIAHEIYKLGIPLIPRIITEMAHSETGIDIHPKAKIGNYFSIDHGTGVVIGATSIIGNNVKLYQGVTLGAKSFPLDETGKPIKGIPRHPIIEDDVIIYSNATILGRITIGKGAVIGGNLWVTENVIPNGKVMQKKTKNK